MHLNILSTPEKNTDLPKGITLQQGDFVILDGKEYYITKVRYHIIDGKLFQITNIGVPK